MGLLDNSRGDDPQLEDFLIVAEFELVPRRRRGALTIGLNTLNEPGGNDNNQSVVIDLHEEERLNISFNPYRPTNYLSSEFNQDREEYDHSFRFSRGNHAEHSSEISDSTTQNSPVSHFSATAEDSDPECRPTPLTKRSKKRKTSDCQHHGSCEEGGHNSTSVPVKRRRVRTKVLSQTPQHCTDPLRTSKKRSEKKNGSKKHRTDHLKKRSKGGKRGKSKKRKRSDKNNTTRCMKRRHPHSGSGKRVVKRNNERLGQQEDPTPERKRKKKRKHSKHAAKHEGRDVAEPSTGSSGKRKRKDDTKSNESQSSGTKDHLTKPPKKKKCEWIINLFTGKTTPTPLPTDSKEDPKPPKKRNRNAK